MSKDTNKQAAEKLFATTAHDFLWANKKGEFFTSENLGAMSLKTGEKLEKFERPAEKETTSDKKELNANDTIAFIKAATTLEVIKQYEGDERKSVKSVYDWKVKQLTAAIKVVEAKVETGANGNEETEGKK